MELLSAPLTGKWRRRNRYERLDGGVKGRKNIRVIRFGGDRSSPPRRVWRVRAARKLKILRIACSSPLKLLKKIKDSYVDMMVTLAGNVSDNVFGSKRVPKARQVPNAAYSNEEFDARMVYEIYKALKATQ
ncbi:uncharacterized protein LOC8265028 [Ricinus communis]|uniref:Uncharacterized protein n=1 Tax=Ricinus communis TaxID=3988 RepID=B9SQ03_RICCO|nr:uncharacterized protein LOC8265028 [Ricinus communis]EEF34322.1 conserved hypothetical protein [Ricinus communis]|eukprot:XP_002528072.1 uncharacterized protein LOC8265028 [Ricinus communis]